MHQRRTRNLFDESERIVRCIKPFDSCDNSSILNAAYSKTYTFLCLIINYFFKKGVFL